MQSLRPLFNGGGRVYQSGSVVYQRALSNITDCIFGHAPAFPTASFIVVPGGCSFNGRHRSCYGKVIAFLGNLWTTNTPDSNPGMNGSIQRCEFDFLCQLVIRCRQFENVVR